MCAVAFVIHSNFILILYSVISLFVLWWYPQMTLEFQPHYLISCLAKSCGQFRIWNAPSCRQESIRIQRLSSQHLYEWLTINISIHKTPRAFNAKDLGKQKQTSTTKMPEKSLHFVLKFSVHVTLRNWWCQWLCLSSEVLIWNCTLSTGVTLVLL